MMKPKITWDSGLLNYNNYIVRLKKQNEQNDQLISNFTIQENLGRFGRFFKKILEIDVNTQK